MSIKFNSNKVVLNPRHNTASYTIMDDYWGSLYTLHFSYHGGWGDGTCGEYMWSLDISKCVSEGLCFMDDSFMILATEIVNYLNNNHLEK